MFARDSFHNGVMPQRSFRALPGGPKKVNIEPVVKYCYAAFRCKTCETLIVIKYLGIADGRAIHTMVFPPEPILTVFPMPCGNCGKTHQYLRTDVVAVNSDQAPTSDYVDQIPLASVISTDVS